MTNSEIAASCVVFGSIGAILSLAVYIFVMDKPNTAVDSTKITESSDRRQCTIYAKQIESQNLEAKANLVDWILRNCNEVTVDRISTDTIPKIIQYRMSH